MLQRQDGLQSGSQYNALMPVPLCLQEIVSIKNGKSSLKKKTVCCCQEASGNLPDENKGAKFRRLDRPPVA